MLRIFRHIHKKLIEQDNARKYLLYAIGEIALVMIGILLALQVNNWNEERKVNRERIEILNALKNDYELTLNTVDYQIERSLYRAEILKKLLSYSAGEDITISEDSLIVMLQESTFFEFARNFSTTYEQAKSSGKLSLIQNEGLLNALSKTEENIEGLTSIEFPVFNESHSSFNASIEIMSIFDRRSNLDWTPESHPELSIRGAELQKFIRSTDTYAKLHHLYFLNNISYLWWGSTKYSTEIVLDEIDISLNMK